MNKFLRVSAICGIAIAFANFPVAADVIVDNSPLASSQIDTISIDPVTGDIFIDTFAGDWSFAEGDNPDPADPVPSVVLKVNNSNSAIADVGSSITLSWSVSQAISCVPLGGNAEWRAKSINPVNGSSNSSTSVTVLTAGSRTYTLSCTNGSNTRSSNVSVTGTTSTPLPDNCPAVENVDEMEWTDIAWGRGVTGEWPRPAGNTGSLVINASRTLAIRFNSATIDLVGSTNGKFSLSNPAGASGIRNYAISTCPGVIEEAPVGCMKLGETNTSSLWWEVDNAKGWGDTVCDLDKGTEGQTYYFNVTYPNGCATSSTCTSYITSYDYR